MIQKERREGQRSRKKLQGEAVIQVIRNNWKIKIRRNKKGERECGVSEFQKVLEYKGINNWMIFFMNKILEYI